MQRAQSGVSEARGGTIRTIVQAGNISPEACDVLKKLAISMPETITDVG